MEMLQAARDRASVNPRAVESFIYGGDDQAATRRRITEIFQSDPNFAVIDRPFMNHSQRYLESARKAACYHLKMEQLDIPPGMPSRWAYEAVDEVLPTDVHQAMFIPALEYQTSSEQRERWLDDAKTFRILGAYVQTELGHGSNVRALETTATFDMTTQEFVVETPRLSATKWWPGGLGKTATHCILHARLRLPAGAAGAGVGAGAGAGAGKGAGAGAAWSSQYADLGVHAFMVQLRDLETLSPLPGANPHARGHTHKAHKPHTHIHAHTRPQIHTQAWRWGTSGRSSVSTASITDGLVSAG